MSKVFAITSGKGGVGKSSISTGLAIGFCRKGKKVLLVDMDEGFRCLDLLLGVNDSIVFDLADVLNGRDLEDTTYACESAEGLYLIPAPAETGLIEPSVFAEFALNAAKKYDVVIFDFPAGMDVSLYSSLPEGTVFLTVAVPDLVSIRDAYVVGRKLMEKSFPARLIINRFIYRQSRKTGFKNIDSIIDSSALRLIGIVPESEEISLLSQNHYIYKKCPASLAFNRICARLSDENIPLPKLKNI